MIKRIGTEARLDMERFFGTRVFLDLRVKVNADWRNDDRALDEMGVPRTVRKPGRGLAKAQRAPTGARDKKKHRA